MWSCGSPWSRCSPRGRERAPRSSGGCRPSPGRRRRTASRIGRPFSVASRLGQSSTSRRVGELPEEPSAARRASSGASSGTPAGPLRRRPRRRVGRLCHVRPLVAGARVDRRERRRGHGFLTADDDAVGARQRERAPPLSRRGGRCRCRAGGHERSRDRGDRTPAAMISGVLSRSVPGCSRRRPARRPRLRVHCRGRRTGLYERPRNSR